ncbi:hypothetical protein ONZ45_g4830 [Pleurotus djamor]|nr:hypothetical protein ONZ45_g4830 [Pleurotus djamor]
MSSQTFASLPPRDAGCLNCDCLGWSDQRGTRVVKTPSHMEDICRDCEHNFVQHDFSIDHIRGRDARGPMPDRTCARFYSHLPVWTASTICQCGNPQSAHERLPPANSFSAAASATSNAVAPPNLPLDSGPSMIPNVLPNISNVTLPLPPAPAGVPAPIGPYQRASSASSIAISANEARNNSIARQNVRTSQSRSQGQSIGGRRTGGGFGDDGDEAPTRDFSVAVLPFKYQDVKLPAAMKKIQLYKISDDQLTSLLPVLKRRSLYLEKITLPSTGVVWQQFETEIEEKLAQKGVYVKDGFTEVVPPEDVGAMKLKLLKPGNPSGVNGARAYKVYNIPHYEFSVKTLLTDVLGIKKANKPTVKNTLDDRLILFVAPKDDNTIRLRPGHQCDGLRAWIEAGLLSESDCPNDDPCQVFSCNTARGASASSSSTPPQDTGRRLRSDSESSLPPSNRRRIDAPAPAPTPDVPVFAAPRRIIPSTYIPPRIAPSDMMHRNAVLDWHLAIISALLARQSPTATLRGTNIKDMATAFLEHILGFLPEEDRGGPARFPQPHTNVTLSAFEPYVWMGIPSVHISTEGGDNDSHGIGTFRAVLTHAMGMITDQSHPVFSTSFGLLGESNLYTIQSTSNDELLLGPAKELKRQLYFTSGCVSAIYIQSLLQNPYPITPWLILYAITQSVLVIDEVTYEHLAYVDPHAAAEAKPWLDFAYYQVLPDDLTLRNGIVNAARHIQLPSTQLLRPRTEEEHRVYTRGILWNIMIGITHPDQDEGVAAFVKGFHLSLPGEDSIFKKYQPHKRALSFVLALSAGPPQSPQEVVDRIEYHTTISKSNTLLYDMCVGMQYRIKRYLLGCGRPDDEPGQGTEDAGLFRVKHFLMALANSDILPTGPIKIRLMSSQVLQHIHIHTCTYDMDLPVSSENAGMFAERCQLDDGLVTEFDRWFFMALDGAANSFNGEFMNV